MWKSLSLQFLSRDKWVLNGIVDGYDELPNINDTSSNVEIEKP